MYELRKVRQEKTESECDELNEEERENAECKAGVAKDGELDER